MARSIRADFMQNHYFIARIRGANDRFARENTDLQADAGFMSISLPTESTDKVEYREGTFLFTRFQPGLTTFDEVTFGRGVAILDTAFFAWMSQVSSGAGEYREDIDILHFHRERAFKNLDASSRQTGNLSNAGGAQLTPTDASKIYTLFNAFPSNLKYASDLDANSADISVQELTIVYEFADLADNPV